MPKRIASLTKKISKNGQALHRAMMSRGANPQEPSKAELALVEERRLLKEEQVKRKARALEPKPSAVDRLVRTHRAQAKEKPKTSVDHDTKDVKKPKAGKSRAEKHAEKAATLEAARRSPKKPATK